MVDGTFDKQMDYHFAHLFKLVPWRYSMELNLVVNGKKDEKTQTEREKTYIFTPHSTLVVYLFTIEWNIKRKIMRTKMTHFELIKKDVWLDVGHHVQLKRYKFATIPIQVKE